MIAPATHAQTGPAGSAAPSDATRQPTEQPPLPAVTVQERDTARPADVTGFGDVPARDVPASTRVVGRSQIEDSGARRLADLTRFDPSVTDSYNPPGYWDSLNIRGFETDPRFNYRREGLPISAETSIPLDNKERVEILKGTSGIQAGTSAPGGLVNYVVKRPTDAPLRQVTLGLADKGSTLFGVDLGGRTDNKVFGYRFNAVREELRPHIDATRGDRSLLSFAGDLRLGRDTLLQAEGEWSSQTQASVPAQSLLGSRLPRVIDPNINLNNQPWSQPNRFDGLTGTVRLDQALNDRWSWTAQYGVQRLKSDDHLAYPFGCSALDIYDRYCPATDPARPDMGLADVYDYRSNNERRRQQAGQLKLQGNIDLGGVRHTVSAGVLRSRVDNRFGFQTDDNAVVGQAATDGSTRLPDAQLPFITPNTNRDETSTELFITDVARWTERFSTWVGARHTRLQRASVRTDGSRATDYSQSFTTPWVGASFDIAAGTSVYGSWGRGIESEVVPGRSRYAAAGTSLPSLESTQREIGLKGLQGTTQWQVALFDIRRPVTGERQLAGVADPADIAALCPDSVDDCRVRGFDGEARHRGIEGSVSHRVGAWQLDGGVTLLRARRSSSDPFVDGRKPPNVPRHTLRAAAEYRVAALPGLSVGASVSHEGRRQVVDNAAEQLALPSWTRLDALVRYQQRLSPTTRTTWLVGVDNLLDRRYWRESPTRYEHIYLYPGAQRTFRVTMRTDF